jgi:nucleoside-diphosphate-sugar epimerase
MRRILVTGASGFIGCYAVAEFAQRGYEVIAPTSRELDLFDEAQVQNVIRDLKPSHLAHFAWYSNHADLYHSGENLQWGVRSVSLFNAFVNSGGKHVFFAGSCAEYYWDWELLKEDSTPLMPKSLYGKGKELLRKHVERLQQDRTVTVAWGRIFFVYGPGEREARFAPSILTPLLRNEPATVRFGNHIRDFLHVEDVARAAAHLLDSSYNGVINIASGNPIRLADFGKKIAQSVGRESLLRIEYGQPSPENPLTLKADITRLQSTGFTPKYSLDEGIKTLLNNP